MNKIEKLIKELCPNGVEWKKLGEVCDIVSGKDYKHLQNGNIPVYGSGGIMTFVNKSAYDKPTVLLPRKGSISNVFYVNGPFWNVDTIYYTKIYEHIIDTKYLFYYLQREHIEKYCTSDAARPALTRECLSKIQIPIPPLPIQTEIVRILDKFVEQQEQLERLIELRKKQYEYYREEMLKPKEGEVWETKRLGEIGTFVRGNGLQKTDFREEGVGCIHYGQIYTYYGMFTNKTKSFVSPELASKLKKVEQGDIVLACTSENIEDVCMCVVWEGEETIVTGGHSSIYKHNQNPRFIAYFLKSKAFEVQKIKYAYGAKVIDIKNDDLEKIYILLPSREKQDKIVDFLNKFEYSIDSLTIALEASKRRYEYYREKSLKF